MSILLTGYNLYKYINTERNHTTHTYVGGSLKEVGMTCTFILVRKREFSLIIVSLGDLTTLISLSILPIEYEPTVWLSPGPSPESSAEVLSFHK